MKYLCNAEYALFMSISIRQSLIAQAPASYIALIIAETLQ